MRVGKLFNWDYFVEIAHDILEFANNNLILQFYKFSFIVIFRATWGKISQTFLSL